MNENCLLYKFRFGFPLTQSNIKATMALRFLLDGPQEGNLYGRRN